MSHCLNDWFWTLGCAVLETSCLKWKLEWLIHWVHFIVWSWPTDVCCLKCYNKKSFFTTPCRKICLGSFTSIILCALNHNNYIPSYILSTDVMWFLQNSADSLSNNQLANRLITNSIVWLIWARTVFLKTINRQHVEIIHLHMGNWLCFLGWRLNLFRVLKNKKEIWIMWDLLWGFYHSWDRRQLVSLHDSGEQVTEKNLISIPSADLMPCLVSRCDSADCLLKVKAWSLPWQIK